MVALPVVHRSAASASPGNLLDMQILRSHLGPTESKTLGVGLSCLCFNKPSRGFWCMLKCENTVQENSCLLDVWVFLITLKKIELSFFLSILFINSLFLIHCLPNESQLRELSHNWMFVYSEAKRPKWCPLSWQRNEGCQAGWNSCWWRVMEIDQDLELSKWLHWFSNLFFPFLYLNRVSNEIQSIFCLIYI